MMKQFFRKTMKNIATYVELVLSLIHILHNDACTRGFEGCTRIDARFSQAGILGAVFDQQMPMQPFSAASQP